MGTQEKVKTLIEGLENQTVDSIGATIELKKILREEAKKERIKERIAFVVMSATLLAGLVWLIDAYLSESIVNGILV